MLSHPATVREALAQTLPDIPVPSDPSYRDYKPTAWSTKKVVPLPAFQYGSIGGIVDVATTALPSPTDPQGHFLGAPMPVMDPTHGSLRTEADILRAMTPYLLYPVNLALHQLLPEGAEVTSAGEVIDGLSRFDMQWTLKYMGQVIKLAVVEVKTTKMVHWEEEFLPGLVTPGNAEARIKDARASENGSLLEGNAVNLSRQVMKYSQFCDDIALFDWESMTVFNFSEANIDDASPPIPTEVVHLQEQKNSAGEGVTYRLLLLGFLLRAVRRHVDLSDRGAHPNEHRPSNYGRPISLPMPEEISDSEEESTDAEEKQKRAPRKRVRFASKRKGPARKRRRLARKNGIT